MVTDLGDVIEKLLMLAGEMDDCDKVIAVDAMIIVQAKRNILEGEIKYAACEAAERDLETLKQAAALRGGAQ
jgi:hypothetical protein